MRKTVEIKNIADVVLYTHTCKDNNIVKTIIDSIPKDIKHRQIYFGDDFLEDVESYYSFIAYDTTKKIVHCFKYNDTWMIKTFYFWGTLEEFEKRSGNSKVCLHNIELLKTI